MLVPSVEGIYRYSKQKRLGPDMEYTYIVLHFHIDRISQKLNNQVSMTSLRPLVCLKLFTIPCACYPQPYYTSRIPQTLPERSPLLFAPAKFLILASAVAVAAVYKPPASDLYTPAPLPLSPSHPPGSMAEFSCPEAISRTVSVALGCSTWGGCGIADFYSVFFFERWGGGE